MAERLDKVLAARMNSRAKAQDAIAQNRVLVNGKYVTKASLKVSENDDIQVLEEEREFVSRAGKKLEAALQEWDVSLEGEVAADIGASTGGFSQCVLCYGAKKVYALDVGHLQLSEKLAQDPRIVSMEGVNCRSIRPDWFEETVDFVCMDVSFISCKTILEPLLETMPPKHIVVLIKPQFECGPEALNKHGVLRDERKAMAIVDDIRSWMKTRYDFVRVMPSPITGRSGNQEFLLYAKDLKSERIEKL